MHLFLFSTLPYAILNAHFRRCCHWRRCIKCNEIWMCGNSAEKNLIRKLQALMNKWHFLCPCGTDIKIPRFFSTVGLTTIPLQVLHLQFDTSKLASKSEAIMKITIKKNAYMHYVICSFLLFCCFWQQWFVAGNFWSMIARHNCTWGAGTSSIFYSSDMDSTFMDRHKCFKKCKVLNAASYFKNA